MTQHIMPPDCICQNIRWTAVYFLFFHVLWSNMNKFKFTERNGELGENAPTWTACFGYSRSGGLWNGRVIGIRFYGATKIHDMLRVCEQHHRYSRRIMEGMVYSTRTREGGVELEFSH